MRKRFSAPVVAIVICSVALVGTATLSAVFGYRMYEDRRVDNARAAYIQAARQGVINLTTINYTTVDEDVKRVLDSSTGSFHDDFERRAKSFAEVVKKAQSKSEGTITAAAIQKEDGGQATVLVTVSLKMGNAGAAEQPPRSWRMVIDVAKTGDTAKISNVQFAT
ncbi:mammalian cell entry protein [Mycobacterium sp. CBMA226]|nr:mammalian cell entry protein [Mycolicibacterium sp. CBMA 226]